jgi:hypothetical protein
MEYLRDLDVNARVVLKYCGVLGYLTTSDTSVACYATEDAVQIVNSFYYSLTRS